MFHLAGVSASRRESRTNAKKPEELRQVEKFVMFVIAEATAGSSPCPKSPIPQPQESPSPSITRLSQSSQEVIEETLGSLANLLTSSAATTTNPSNARGTPTSSMKGAGAPTPVRTSNWRGGANKKEHHRQSLLRKKSSLNALTPEDLGRVVKSATCTSSFVSNISTSRADFSSLISLTQTDHLSTFHLRNPIERRSRISDGSHGEDLNTTVVTKGQRSSSHSGEDGGCHDESATRDSHNPTDSDTASANPAALSLSEAEQEYGKDQMRLSSTSPPKNLNLDDRHMCVHHYHHHSHHHHHYYQCALQKCESSFSSKMKSEGSNGDTKQENLHNDNSDSSSHGKKYSARFPTRPIFPDPPSPPSSPKSQHNLQDMSFYRKFSATSPFRSKSSLAWADAATAAAAQLNVVSLWPKSKKSRSTPIKLDRVSERVSLPPISVVHYDSGTPRMCGGCIYCSKNEFSCSCCCDECCCARQFSHDTSIPAPGTIEEAEKSGSSPNSRTASPEPESGKFLPGNRSRSMDSLMQPGNYGDDDDYDIKIDDELLLNEALMDARLLSHFHFSESEEDSDEPLIDVSPEFLQSPRTMSVKHSHFGQVHLASRKSDLSANHVISPSDVDEEPEVPPRKDNKIKKECREGRGSSENLQSGREQLDKSTNVRSRRGTKATVESPLFGAGGSSHKNKVGKRGTLRIANGEVRSSPTVTAVRATTREQFQQQSPPRHPSPSENNGISSSPITFRGRSDATSAMMTVTVDTMSLFLDAVHVQMSQD